MKKDLYQDSETLRRAYQLSAKEIEEVLSRKKHPTDLTRIAAVTIGSFSRIKSVEVHEKALELMIERKDLKMLEGPK
jgi:hypothetical protein